MDKFKRLLIVTSILLLLVACTKEEKNEIKKLKSDKQFENSESISVNSTRKSDLSSSVKSVSANAIVATEQVIPMDQTTSDIQSVVYTKINTWKNARDYYEIAFNRTLADNITEEDLSKYVKAKPVIDGYFEKIDDKIIRFYPQKRFEGNTEYKFSIEQKALFASDMPKVELSFYNSSPNINLREVSLYTTDDNKYYFTFVLRHYNGRYLDREYQEGIIIRVDNKEIDIDKIEYESSGRMLLTSKEFSAPKTSSFRIYPKNKIFNSRSEKELYYSNSLAEMLKFNLNNINTITDKQGKARIELTFSKNLNNQQSLVGFLSIDGRDVGDSQISKYLNKIVITGEFTLGKEYKVGIKSGIKAFDNSKLKEDMSKTIETYNRDRSLEFVDNGIFLSSKDENSINIKVINYQAFDYELWSVQVENVAEMIHNLNLLEYSGNYASSYYRRENLNWYGNLIKSDKIETKVEIDKESYIKLDLDDVIEDDPQKIYILNLTGSTRSNDPLNLPRNYRYYRNNKESRILLSTDYALSAKVFSNSVAINVIDVLNKEPVSRVDIELRAYNNTLLAEGSTNRKGFLLFDDLEVSLEGREFFIVAENSNKLGFLSSQSMQIDNSKFKVENSYYQTNYKVQAFLDRDVYRPGEKVNLIVLARDNDNKLIKEDLPLLVTVYDGQGSKIVSEKIKDFDQGFATYQYLTKESSKTGSWRMEVEYASMMKSVYFTLESFVPERFNTRLKADKDFYQKEDNNLNLLIENNYLFGKALNDAKCQLNLSFNHDYSFANEKYSEYIFSDDFTSIDYSMFNEQMIFKTNQDGVVNVKLDLLDKTYARNPYFININAKVTEKGGRPIERQLVLPVSPLDNYIGLSSNRYLKPKNNEFKVPLVVVDNKGEKLVKDSQVDYVVYAKRGSWWWDYDNIDQTSFKSSESTVVVKKGSVTIGRDKYINFTPKTSDFHVFFIEAKIHGQDDYEINRKYYNSYWGDSSEITEDTSLELKLDKDEYVIGDKVRLSIPSSKDSKIYINLVKQNEIIEYDIISPNKDGLQIYEFEVNEDMLPNIYAEVRLVQGIDNKKNDMPIRLYGIIPISVVDEDTRLNISLNIPDRITSNSKLKASIDVGDNKKTKYIVSIVDQGLVNRTNYNMPNPWNFFYGKEAYYARDYDNFNFFVNAQEHNIFRTIMIGGGMDAEASFAAMSKGGLANMREMNRLQETGVQRFKPVTYFLGILETDRDGKGEFEVDIEDYIGSLRVNVIAINEDAFGAETGYTIVKDDVILMPTLPRVLSPQDEFEIPVNVIIDSNVKSPVIVELITNDLVEIVSDSKITIKAGKTSEFLTFRAKVSDNIGKADFTFKTISQDFQGQRKVDLGIRLPAPYSFEAKILDFTEREISLDVPKKGYDSSNQVYLTFTQGFEFDAQQLIRRSFYYYYGGAFIKTITALNQLLLSEFIDDVNIKNEIDETINFYFQEIVNYNRQGLYPWRDLWREDSERRTLNIYALHTAVIAKEKGYNINSFVFNEIINYLKKNSPSGKQVTFIDAYQLYVLALAGQADIAKLNYYSEKNGIEVTSDAVAMLAIAYEEAGYDFKDIQKNITKVNINNNSNNYSRLSNPSDDVKGAIELFYKTKYGNQSSEDKAKNRSEASAIVHKLQSKNYWSFNEMNWNLWGLTAYIETLGKDYNKFKQESLEVTIDGKSQTIKVNDFYSLNLTDYKEKEVLIKAISEDAENISITLYNNYVPRIEDSENYSNGIELFVTYTDLSGSFIDVSTLDQGQTFYANLEVIPEEKNNDFALTYILPSGWEFAEQDYNNYTSQKEMPKYVDIRDDRAIIYGNINYSSSLTYSLKITATSKGKFTMPATSVEYLYLPEIRATLKGKTIQVK